MGDWEWVLYVSVFIVLVAGGIYDLKKKIWSIQAELWELHRAVGRIERRLRKLGLDDSNEGEG